MRGTVATTAPTMTSQPSSVCEGLYAGDPVSFSSTIAWHGSAGPVAD